MSIAALLLVAWAAFLSYPWLFPFKGFRCPEHRMRTCNPYTVPFMLSGSYVVGVSAAPDPPEVIVPAMMTANWQVSKTGGEVLVTVVVLSPDTSPGVPQAIRRALAVDGWSVLEVRGGAPLMDLQLVDGLTTVILLHCDVERLDWPDKLLPLSTNIALVVIDSDLVWPSAPWLAPDLIDTARRIGPPYWPSPMLPHYEYTQRIAALLCSQWPDVMTTPSWAAKPDYSLCLPNRWLRAIVHVSATHRKTAALHAQWNLTYSALPNLPRAVDLSLKLEQTQL